MPGIATLSMLAVVRAGMRRSRLGLAGVDLVGVVYAPALAHDSTGDSDHGRDLFSRVFETIHGNYVRPVTRDALAGAAIDGMLVSLDPQRLPARTGIRGTRGAVVRPLRRNRPRPAGPWPVTEVAPIAGGPPPP